jgi:hypothetical protein
MEMIDISMLLTIIGILTGITNIVVEVLKKITYNIIPTEFLAVIVAELLTIIFYIAYCNKCGIVTVWYFNFAAVVVGLMVAYAAMFGFEKLKEALDKVLGGSLK